MLAARINGLGLVRTEYMEENSFILKLFKINLLKQQVQAVQQSVAMARSGVVQPNILSMEEISKFDIDFKKLKGMKIGAASYKINVLILALKIPAKTITTNKKLILPIPNEQ